MKPRERKKPPKKPVHVETDDEMAASRMGRWMGGLVILFIVTLGVMLLGVYPRTPGPGTGRPIELDFEGEDSARLADKLMWSGVIEDATYFKWYLRLTGGTRGMVRGAHLLTDDASPREVVHRLERRGADHVKVVIPEGWTRYDIAKRLDATRVCTTRRFLDATEDKEGFLFPATYDLELDSDPSDIVRQMQRLFEKRWDALANQHDAGLKELADTLGWGKREVVVLASMIEKEAAVDDERPIIASVFLNRLRDATFKPARKLQSDPTSGYGCLVLSPPPPSCASYTGKITHDINVDPANTYSTYVTAGLPPGPICNPGAKSIEAVLSPSLTHYYFFVAKGGGRHTFSETLGDHNAAINK